MSLAFDGRRLARLAVAGCAVASCAVAGCADDGGPRLISAMPAAAPPNAMVTLTGSRLCGGSPDCSHAAGEILIGIALPMVQAAVTSYSDTGAVIVIPAVAPAGKSALIVTVNDQSSNAIDFEVLP